MYDQDTLNGTEGLIANEDLFDLDLSDADINNLLDQRIREAEEYWYGSNPKKGQIDLKHVYEMNRRIWLPKHLDTDKLYRHELQYQDPRVFVSTETLISQANARVANPEIAPGSESVASRHLSKDLEAVILAWCRDHKMKMIQRQVTRGNFLNRHAYAFLYWDENYGENGDVCVEYVSGKDCLPDPDAKLGQNPRYFIRNKTATLQELILRFPDKESDLLKEAGKVNGRTSDDANGGALRGTKSQLGKVYGYREVWFTYYAEDGTPKEAVAWKMNKLTLGAISNPNWNETGRNHLPVPLKPFIPLNYLNTGDSVIDDTTLIEQAAAAQELLDKRGRQAVEITDQSSGGLIFNSSMISKKEGMKLTGHPKEKVFVNGDVRSAVVRLAPTDVSPAIINDKEDARNTINETFGTHAPTRGEASGNNTLGQDVLQSQKDLTRNDELIRCIDTFFHDFYKYLVQMFVVFYDDEHWFDAVGDDGKFDRICMTSDKIEDGCSVYVEPGSTLPIDKAAMRDIALALAKMQLTDPLSLYEDLGVPNPSKRFKRLVDWLRDPGKMVQDIDDEDFDRMAFMDIQVLLAGEEPEVRNAISDRYLKFFNNYIKSGEFADLQKDAAGRKKARAITSFLKKETEVLQNRLTLEEATLPTPEEMAAGNQAATEQAAQQAAIMQGQPQDPASAAMESTTPAGQPMTPPPAGTSSAVSQMQMVPTASTPTQ